MPRHHAKHEGISNSGSMQGVTFEPGDNDNTADTARDSSSGGGISNSGVMTNVVVGDNTTATNVHITRNR